MLEATNAKTLTRWLNESAPGFLFIFVLSLAYAFPLLLDGRYYLDDLPHAISGLTLWEQDGRPLASIVSSLVSFQLPSFTSPALIDISPLPQILGLVALSYSAARLARSLFNQPPDIWAVLVVFPIIASPFMLQNLSYKFDALTMSLAIMLAILAALPRDFSIRSITQTTGLLIAALCLYQAALNVFMATTALLCLAQPGTAKNLVSKNLLSLAIAILIYTLLIKLLGGISDEYATAHSRLIPLNADGLQTILFNFGFGNFFVMEAVADAPWLYGAGSIALVLFIIKATREGQGLPATALSILAVLVLVASIMGLLLVLAQPVVRPRTLIALSILLVAMGFAFNELVKEKSALWKAPLIIATAWYFVLAYGYADAARDQTRFEDYLASRIITDLYQAGFKPNDKLAFDGTEPRSPIAENSARLKTVARILQLDMNSNSEWGFRLLESLGLKSTAITDATEPSLKALCTDPPIATASAYQLFKQQETYVISFANGVCFKP